MRWIAVASGALALAGCSGEIREPGVDPGEPLVCADGSFEPAPALVRRLTVGEYARSVEAVMGVDIAAEADELLPADVRADGFSNTAATLIVTLEHVEAYEELAALALSRVGDLDAFAASYAPCTELAETQCRRGLIAALGAAVFRRPVADDEIDALVPIFDIVAAEGEGFGVAAGLVAEAMLQAPPFLYRLENESGDGLRWLDGYEMASRLSYLLWSAPPDGALFQAAAAGGLRTEAEVEAQVLRMLEDPRARAASRLYLADWLHLDRLDDLTRDPELFPDWTPALGAAMKRETLAFFEHLVWDEDLPLADLFNAPFTVADPILAQHYGLADDAAEPAVYDLSDVAERGGVLTQGALLTVGGNRSSMVSRGLYLLETLMCGEIDSPPPGVDTTPPEVAPGASQRTYSEQRVTNTACQGCHQQMEPHAWGLERFDATGAYRLTDEYGNELRQDGYVVFPGATEPAAYDSVSELMDLLAGSPAVQACMAKKATQFAMGRQMSEADACAVEDIQARFAASPGRYRDLMVAMATSPLFRTVLAE